MTAATIPISATRSRRRWKWLLLRRLSQLGILGLFLLGPLAGIWIVTGTLSSSLTLGVLPLTDPFLLLQTVASGHLPEATALLGASLVAGFYLVVGGRAFCGWVCPVNLVTDAAAWLREKAGIRPRARPSRATRYWLLTFILIATALLGIAVWEWLNPVSMLHRGLIFGVGLAWTVPLAVFLFDLLVVPRGWCGHLCPMGATYGLLGAGSLVRIRADRRDRCDDCMECFRVCPEPQVIQPALKGAPEMRGPVILDMNCTNCGRCIDVCDRDVFRFGTRFNNTLEASS
ncbi:MAG: quinol dehydrogenase ferredoxin subunit NapH [Gammaproteobacteria bacterium]|nr:quinol dehydrogenase ferredoxin subunit NapH [Gammaproteobacteria bacterium]